MVVRWLHILVTQPPAIPFPEFPMSHAPDPTSQDLSHSSFQSRTHLCSS